MTHLVFSPASRRDLQDIVDYIAHQQGHATAANALVDKIEETCSRLAELPGMGVSREELAPGLRAFPVARYVIFYRRADAGVEIVRIVHGARDLSRLFHDESE